MNEVGGASETSAPLLFSALGNPVQAGLESCVASHAVRCMFPRSVLRLSMQRAACDHAACWTLRSKVADGRPKAAYVRPKAAYVHPKTANGDSTRHREDSHHTAQAGFGAGSS